MQTPTPAVDKDYSHKRSIRSESFISAKTLLKANPSIIGCGAVGRQVALMLASMGVGGLDLWDHDKVSPENLGPQQWNESCLELTKANCLGDDALLRNSMLGLACMAMKFESKDIFTNPFVFCCVDSMDARKVIAERFLATAPDKDSDGTPALFIDTRMTAFYFEIHVCLKSDIPDYLKRTIFPQSEADPTPCTAKATAYCANACASLAVHSFVEHLRGHPREKFFAFDLFSKTLPKDPHRKDPAPCSIAPLPTKSKPSPSCPPTRPALSSASPSPSVSNPSTTPTSTVGATRSV